MDQISGGNVSVSSDPTNHWEWGWRRCFRSTCQGGSGFSWQDVTAIIATAQNDRFDDIFAVRLDQGAHKRERFIFADETTEEVSGFGI